jgi:serine/threonine protein kinase
MGELFAGRYELVDPLGQGAAGVVFRAWDHTERAYVAAKVLRQSDALGLMRFVREQSLRVRHAHVVPVLGWAGADDRVLFTMPIIAGGSVATLLADYGPLPLRWVLDLVDQTLDGLVAVHAAGLVHRDVKPSNLLLDVTGIGAPHLYLSDFGIAAVPGQPRLTMTDTLVGTPGYSAPEQRHGVEPHARADLYSIGVLGTQLLTAREPGGAGVDVPSSVTREPIWPDVEDWLRRATDPDPASRFDSAGTARAQLRQLRAGWEPFSEPDEPVEVFDQLPPLPPGWGPDGPASASASLAPAPAPPLAPAAPATAPLSTASTSTGRVPMPAVLLGAAGVLLVLAALVYWLAG